MFVNCTLKRSPTQSHTQGLADRSIATMEALGVSVRVVRAVDEQIATGVYLVVLPHARRIADRQEQLRQQLGREPTPDKYARHFGYAD